MTRRIISVLGGSSPFTAALVDSLATCGSRFVKTTLVLHGRNRDNLDLIARYARAQLSRFGWRVASTTRWDEALTGADVVIHQIRYGGLEGRAEGERLCCRWNVHADETLGPAALLSAIRSRPGVMVVCDAIRRHCPDAWVLNLTNPLSAVTAAMCQFGVSKCIGACELPSVTAYEAARVLQLPIDQVSWTYSGFNHRGFIHSLQYRSTEYVHKLPEALRDEALMGVKAGDIQQLEAIPLKYFRLVREPPTSHNGRSDFLIGLRRRISAELQHSVISSPPSLRQRYLEWYPKAVVPMIDALANTDATIHVVNLPRDDGIVVEVLAEVGTASVRQQPPPPCGRAAQHWLDVFENHERRFFDAMLDPTRQAVLETLASDPIVPDGLVEQLADDIWSLLKDKSEPKPTNMAMPG
jgi:6-phospho-beta-glucosidase